MRCYRRLCLHLLLKTLRSIRVRISTGIGGTGFWEGKTNLDHKQIQNILIGQYPNEAWQISEPYQVRSADATLLP
eukprot:SAG31_NODE_1830_length_7152_cov_2.148306_10_plen_75_part_00